ncbi:hypothetical protein Asppvi_005439 [Aspergillus pseudoviridinutans]|uniref:Uncharacterized protein n=1 Tax=Aspergillus pseudoviridinutans TaxID=1517512 RepID=A0A9P3BC12_9EURO|nr:uncharacterized protein Asppvi_005439 [Aspergillus pseudoviridinutans]GIJ86550.1 hypothetical protein Asppvi_005439 [Aspergillus pseudoviridinutans]
MKRPSTSANAAEADKNGSARYGVEISEYALPLYSWEIYAVHLDMFRHGGCSQAHRRVPRSRAGQSPNDFTITSGKKDTDAEEGGALRPGDYWKQIYVAFAAIPDDVQIPPNAFLDGSYRYLGHAWDDCRPPAEVEFVEMCLWRQMLTQYFEKVDPEVYRLLKAKTTLMMQYRVHTGNTLGCAALILETEGLVSRGVEDNALEAASIAQSLSMDMAKEARWGSCGAKRRRRWREIGYSSRGSCAGFMRFASLGLHYVPMMDRYLDRVRGNTRFPITRAKARILEPFINRAYVREGLNPDGLLFNKMDGIVAIKVAGVSYLQ